MSSKCTTNEFAYALIKCCTRGEGGGGEVSRVYFLALLLQHRFRVIYVVTLHVSSNVQVHELCWVNSHIFKAQFSGKAGSCFLIYSACGFFDPPTQGECK